MTKGQETVQRLLAVVVIMAMLGVMGIPLTVIVFFATVVYFVWRAVQRSEQQDIKNIFDFYIAANEILRDDEKRWYGFEINQVVSEGERVMHLMPDPPPLVYFALGALYHRAGDHESAVEQLSYVTENEQGDENYRFQPSPELRRYVEVLRRIERDPSEAPQTMAAIRSLERARRTRAAAMLDQSRVRVGEGAAHASIPPAPHAHGHGRAHKAEDISLSSLAGRRHQPPPPPPPAPPTTMTPPAPIAEVLRDLYEEEKKTA